uniref:Uncharacterized protein n=1 Tax=Candidatus Kentrum sp. FM TaxID=2126340 RepID=A0A450T1Y9_9GAMM|nr:MAG: hypothetical protein BECKFM1743A_GA0114220_102661 [Candidatus Kentron sp. FM]VFK10897.1 MAG: hypothetical protein BECKFM1743B_GA0114221_101593 [Candidatus Kentron sp. FM]
MKQPINQHLTPDGVSQRVREHMGERFTGQHMGNTATVHEIDSLKQRFDLMEKRLEAMRRENDARFLGLDQRIDQCLLWFYIAATLGAFALMVALYNIL